MNWEWIGYGKVQGNQVKETVNSNTGLAGKTVTGVIVDYLTRGKFGSSYARALIDVRDDVELKDNIVVAMPKLVGKGFYTCNNIDSDVVKDMKKPSQTPRSVSVGPKVFLVDDEGKPLTKVVSSGDHDSEDEIASVANDMSNFLASTKDDYGTNSLLKQWKESYVNGD
nr:hypothetical protein [Tanacetum cinerariifolium]